MSNKHYAVAIQGAGLVHAIKRFWVSRFASVRAFVLIPQESIKIEMAVGYKRGIEAHVVKLTMRNWRTGEERVLFEGHVYEGTPQRIRNFKD